MRKRLYGTFGQVNFPLCSCLCSSYFCMYLETVERRERGEEKKSAGFAYSALCIIRREKDSVGEDRPGKTQEEGIKSMARTGVAAAASGYDKRPTPEDDVSQKTPIVPRSCKEKETRQTRLSRVGLG